jgi:hypothetical protein
VTAFLVALLFVVLPGFRSPTGNIRCAATATVLHCDITRADYRAKLQDRCLNPNGELGTGVDWHGFEVTRTRASIACAGGTWLAGDQHPRYTTLHYGVPWKAGPFTCVVRRAGVTCVDGVSHGVFISRQSYRVF